MSSATDCSSPSSRWRVGTVVGWLVYGPHAWFEGVYNVLTAPVEAYKAVHPDRSASIELTFTGITAPFSLHFSVAIFTGVILSSPVWLYQVWAFIVPGLTRKEKRVSLAFIGSAVPLFLLGLWIAHISLPLVIGVLLDFTPTNAANLQTATDYISFVTRFSLGFGAAFLLPVFLVAFNVIGILPLAPHGPRLATRGRRDLRLLGDDDADARPVLDVHPHAARSSGSTSRRSGWSKLLERRKAPVPARVARRRRHRGLRALRPPLR